MFVSGKHFKPTVVQHWLIGTIHKWRRKQTVVKTAPGANVLTLHYYTNGPNKRKCLSLEGLSSPSLMFAGRPWLYSKTFNQAGMARRVQAL